MSKRNKILKISLSLIIVSLVVAMVSISKLRMDKPVFLMNYCEVGTNGNEEISTLSQGRLILKYISNVEDKRRVTNITFKEAPNINFFAFENNQWESMMFNQMNESNIDKYGRYGIHRVDITCPNLKYEDFTEELMLTSATVEFDDGLKMDVDLGKIILYKEKRSPVALEHISTRASNDGTSSITLKVTEDTRIEKVESPLLEEASRRFDFHITSSELGEATEREYENGRTIKKDSTITCSSSYKTDDNILEAYNVYDIKPRIWFRNDYEDRYSMRYHNMTNNNKQYTYYGLYKYLKDRGEI